LVGTVPIRLDAPRPYIPDEADDPIMAPGPPGPRGMQGVPGQMVFIPQDENDDVVTILVKL
jgi:hypothetical protein